MSELLDTLSRDKWHRIGTQRRAGVLVPLFSIYSANSVGIGDFNDLKLLIDWCAKTGNSILQFLPMNELGATFCPYDAISSFALEPAYISLTSLASARKSFVKAGINKLRKRFPAGPAHVDYGIKKAKGNFLRELYLEEGPPGPDGAFKRFAKENSYWLDNFALFKVIKDSQDGRPWYEWTDGYKDRDAPLLKDFEKKHAEEIAFQKWTQWIAYTQFEDVKLYAVAKKIKVCGDLPILISRDSADVWAHPQFFKLEFAAGAPPDMYCAKGQRWGMPTYNWEEIAKDRYRYLEEKLKYAENFYDMLRVDHIVGLFRIWSIPYDEPLENEGLNGFFDPRDEKQWGERGRRILSVMNESTDLLLLAEDLGVIPEECPKALKKFGVPGNDVQRWTKDWAVSHDFLKPERYRLMSVAMLSTHDTTNWPAWWQHEAGTVDEALFMRRCAERGIDYACAAGKLFDPARSRYGRLRWLGSIDSVDLLVSILGKRREELKDFIEMYEDTYREKEKLWEHMGLTGDMREPCDRNILAAAFSIVLKARSIFRINLLIDYLYLADLFKGDPCQYRINRPGTTDKTNWSLVMPLPLEELLTDEVTNLVTRACRTAKSMVR